MEPAPDDWIVPVRPSRAIIERIVGRWSEWSVRSEVGDWVTDHEADESVAAFLLRLPRALVPTGACGVDIAFKFYDTRMGLWVVDPELPARPSSIPGQWDNVLRLYGPPSLVRLPVPYALPLGSSWSIAGTFSHWLPLPVADGSSTTSTFLKPTDSIDDENDRYAVLPLLPGDYDFKWCVNGREWVLDPHAGRSRAADGSENNRVSVYQSGAGFVNPDGRCGLNSVVQAMLSLPGVMTHWRPRDDIFDPKMLCGVTLGRAREVEERASDFGEESPWRQALAAAAVHSAERVGPAHTHELHHIAIECGWIVPHEPLDAGELLLRLCEALAPSTAHPRAHAPSTVPGEGRDEDEPSKAGSGAGGEGAAGGGAAGGGAAGGGGGVGGDGGAGGGVGGDAGAGGDGGAGGEIDRSRAGEAGEHESDAVVLPKGPGESSDPAAVPDILRCVPTTVFLYVDAIPDSGIVDLGALCSRVMTELEGTPDASVVVASIVWSLDLWHCSPPQLRFPVVWDTETGTWFVRAIVAKSGSPSEGHFVCVRGVDGLAEHSASNGLHEPYGWALCDDASLKILDDFSVIATLSGEYTGQPKEISQARLFSEFRPVLLLLARRD